MAATCYLVGTQFLLNRYLLLLVVFKAFGFRFLSITCHSLNARENILMRVTSGIAFHDNLLQSAGIIAHLHSIELVMLLLLVLKFIIMVTSRGRVGFKWPMSSILVTVFLPDLWPPIRSLHSDPMILMWMRMILIHGDIVARLYLYSSPHIRTDFLPWITGTFPTLAAATTCALIQLHMLIM